MTEPRDPDRLIDAFLAVGPTELPERTYHAVRDQIDHTPQRVVIGPWRKASMSNVTRIAVAAVVIVAAGFGLTRLLPASPAPGVGANPDPSPSPSATAAPTPTLQPTPPASISLTIDKPFPARLQFTATTDWYPWGDVGATGKGWFKVAADPPAGLGVTVWRVVDAYPDPCFGDLLDPPLGPSVDDLADLLANQPHTKILQDSPVTLDGYDGRYLEYTADLSDCSVTIMRRWSTNAVTRDALDGEHDQVWILDVDGTRVVIDAFDFPGTSEADRAELRAVVESVQIDPN